MEANQNHLLLVKSTAMNNTTGVATPRVTKEKTASRLTHSRLSRALPEPWASRRGGANPIDRIRMPASVSASARENACSALGYCSDTPAVRTIHRPGLPSGSTAKPSISPHRMLRVRKNDVRRR